MSRVERPRRLPGWRRWLLLAGALVALYGLVQLTRWVSPRLSGAAGELWRDASANDRRSGAIFYTEVGSVGEYLRRARRARGAVCPDD